MTIIEKTHELGKLIEESAEMKAFRAAEKAQAEDEATQELLREFNLNRMNLVKDLQDGKITQQEAVQKNTEAFDKITEQSELIRNFIEAKKTFDKLVEEVNGVLNYYITGQEPGCTHNCSSCSGCH